MGIAHIFAEESRAASRSHFRLTRELWVRKLSLGVRTLQAMGRVVLRGLGPASK